MRHQRMRRGGPRGRTRQFEIRRAFLLPCASVTRRRHPPPPDAAVPYSGPAGASNMLQMFFPPRMHQAAWKAVLTSRGPLFLSNIPDMRGHAPATFLHHSRPISRGPANNAQSMAQHQLVFPKKTALEQSWPSDHYSLSTTRRWSFRPVRTVRLLAIRSSTTLIHPTGLYLPLAAVRSAK